CPHPRSSGRPNGSGLGRTDGRLRPDRWRCLPYDAQPSKRADREISQPEVGKAAGLPDAEQGPVDGEAQGIVAALDRDPDAFAEIAAFDERAACQSAAAGRTRAIEPERQREAVAEQKIH